MNGFYVRDCERIVYRGKGAATFDDKRLRYKGKRRNGEWEVLDEKKTRRPTKRELTVLCTVKSLPNSDVVQTEASTCEGKRFDCKATRVDEDGLEARRARRR